MTSKDRAQHVKVALRGLFLAGSCLLIYKTFKRLYRNSRRAQLAREDDHKEELQLTIQNGAPEAAPLKTVEDLWNYTAPKSVKCFRSHYVKAHFKPLPESSSRLLVCHDMAGGYLNDRFVQGGSYDTAYRIFDWPIIDIFIYFGHTFITIPPAGWIDAGHQSGTRILGTFITEWDAGAEICSRLFLTKQTAEKTAVSLAQIAKDFGFDGWLINIENTVSKEKMKNVTFFLEKLTSLLHDFQEESQVIWYDSVTTEGELKWQDQLNELNYEYFNACDGIFTNYTWKEDYPAKSASIAGNRRLDVYYGIDVFGRNTFGGGGMTCNKALDVIKAAGLSAALFAPGWVMQDQMQSGGVFPSGASVEAWNSIEHEFIQKNDEFWKLIRPYFDWNSVAFSNNRLLTFFNQGAGKQFWTEGQEVYSKDFFWYNLSMQSPDMVPFDAESSSINCTINYNDAFEGGSCLAIQGILKLGEIQIVPLFKVAMEQGEGEMQLNATYKISTCSKIQLLLIFKDSSSKARTEKVISIDQNDAGSTRLVGTKDSYLQTLSKSSKPQGDWLHSSFSLSEVEVGLVEIQLICACINEEGEKDTSRGQISEFACFLGSLSYGPKCPPGELKNVRVEGCTLDESTGLASFMLLWDFDEHAAFVDVFFAASSEHKHNNNFTWLGRSYSNRYQVIAANPSTEFHIQKVDLLGCRQDRIPVCVMMAQTSS